ncbi:MAG: hypothetical protein A2042_07220 [Candidatus Schekmanbacteria bacterium GWA2_38_11]|uniref:Uncharacterized protein n=1 Tax=Candidatus Schekmanbacteria bacterium GWA2_38_11 TaxID=1817876 RepID=A0A1F7RCH0_9BACT|nr:MAG: hypothetical protein A2042_07220 [Candidatus Schekmanbacteria bacterium GWA2_38_11]
MEDFNLMLDSLDKKNKEMKFIGTKSTLLLTELLSEMGKGELSANEVGNKVNEVLNKVKELTSLTESPSTGSSQD